MDPESLTGYFYYRAYFNMGTFARVFERLGMPGEALELLLGLEQDGPEKPHMKPGAGIVRRLPHLFAFAVQLGGIHGRLRRLSLKKKPAYELLAAKMEVGRTPMEWLHLATDILNETKDIAYYNIMIPMLAMMHHRMLAGLLEKQGYDIRMIELIGASEAAAKYNPQNTLQVLHEKYFAKKREGAENVEALSPEQEENLQTDIGLFLRDFGHFSDSGNDCSSIPWRETPDLIRRMVAQPRRTSRNEAELLKFSDIRFPGMKRFFAGILYRRTSRFAVSREEISSLYTLGYGQFRTCFIHLGEELVKQGAIADREDIYFLYWDELVELVQEDKPVSKHDLVASRRLDIEAFSDAMIPDLILGYEQPPLATHSEGALRGIPTSLGTYTGPARIVKGINDFEKVRDGDVLIIPFSDVGWTPLFAKAGAVIAESGGILSHSSIVAREYRIPAVVSVSGACRIEEGRQVTVNGNTGEIAFLEGREE
jgi:phosphohistidine swiveling domain-containing protein